MSRKENERADLRDSGSRRLIDIESFCPPNEQYTHIHHKIRYNPELIQATIFTFRSNYASVKIITNSGSWVEADQIRLECFENDFAVFVVFGTMVLGNPPEPTAKMPLGALDKVRT